MNGEDTLKAKFELMDFQLQLCYAEVVPEVTLAVEAQLSKTPAIYPYLQSIVETFNIATGSYSFQIEDVYSSRIPIKLTIALVINKAYTGDIKSNPFNFQTFNLNRLEC